MTSNKVLVGGVNVNLQDRKSFFAEIKKSIKNKKKLAITSVNLQHIYLYGAFSAKKINSKIFTSHVDGEPVKRFIGKKYNLKVEKLAGSEMLPEILAFSEKNNYKVLFLGGSSDSHKLIKNRASNEYPNLLLEFISPSRESILSNDTKIIKEINKKKADILIVSLPKPLSEDWVEHNIVNLTPSVSLCYGAAADFYAGVQKQSPKLFSDLGLEWFWRFTHQPKRLFKRYFIQGVPSIFLLLYYSKEKSFYLTLTKFKKIISNILFTTDIFTYFASLVISFYIRNNFDSLQELKLNKTFLMILIPLLLIFNIIFGGTRISNVNVDYKNIFKSIRSLTYAYISLIMISYTFKLEISRAFLLIMYVITLSMSIFFRVGTQFFIKKARKSGYLLIPVLTVGNSELITHFKERIKNPKFGYSNIDPIKYDEKSQGEITLVYDENSLASDYTRIRSLQNNNYIILPNYNFIASSNLSLDSVLGYTYLTVKDNPYLNFSKKIKRMFDVIFSLAVLLITSPLLILVSILIKLNDGGPVFFKQKRVGYLNKEIYIYKFRTMVVNAESKLDEISHLNTSTSFLFKVKDDPRITNIGKYLRKYSIDEIPQFFNVIKGDMSVVGPRPALYNEVKTYYSDSMFRHKVRPGITGLWQVSGRSNLNSQESLALDLFYVYNWSHSLDISILFKTISVVLSGSDSY